MFWTAPLDVMDFVSVGIPVLMDHLSQYIYGVLIGNLHADLAINCIKHFILEEGFAEGWDYAPRMYPFKVISPRTCGNCGGIEGTAWYEICVKHKKFDELTEKQKQTVMRICNEPESIMAIEEYGGNGMQINIALDRWNQNQAKLLRDTWYPNTTSRQTRDAFIFNDAIDRFDAKLMEELPTIIERDNGNATVQRMLTIKQESNKKLEDIAASIGCSKTATYRAIIAYWIDKIDVTDSIEKPAESEEISQLLIVKVALLEKQLAACTQTLQEIRELTENK